MSRSDVALFVDWDNLKIELNKKGQSPTISRLWELAEEYGRLVVAKAYADWPSRFDLRMDQYNLYVEGIEPVYVPCRAPDRRWIKNSVDVKMSADCLDVSYLNPNIRVFVLASGDIDFLHVADSLRRRGLQVVVIGVRGSTSNRLGDGVDERVFYDEAPSVPTASPLASPAKTKPVFAAMRRVLEEQKRANNYPLIFTRFKPLLKAAMKNDFDEADYGAKKFKDVALAAEREGVLRVVTRNLIDWAILPEDEAPAPGLPPVAEEPAAREEKAEKETVSTSDAILSELVCTYVELAQSNLFSYIAPGLLQQYSLLRAKKTASDLPPGFTHAEKLEGINNSMLGKHVSNAIRKGVFKQIPQTNATTESTFMVLHLNAEHPIVQEVLDRPTRDAASI